MALLKEDGSLNVEWINMLPLEEHLNVVARLTPKQHKEYCSKQRINESKNPQQVCYVDKPMEEWGKDAMEFLNKMKESLR